MDRRNVVILLIIILEVTTLTFQVGGLGTPSAVLEVTEVKSLEGTERVEFTDEDYVPTLTVLPINDTPFDVDNWHGYCMEAYHYGYWDALTRHMEISLLNLTDLTLELQFGVENGTQTVELKFGDLTNSTSANENQTQTLILHVELEDLPDLYPGYFKEYFSMGTPDGGVSLRTGGVFFRDVEPLSFRVWATSTIPLVPVSFELNRSDNETLRVHQSGVMGSRYIYVDIHPTNVTSLPDANGLHGEFRPWRSVDRIFLPSGTYWFDGILDFSLTLMANRSVTCRYYALIDKLSFVPNVEVPGTFVWGWAGDELYEEELVDSPSIYIWSASHFTVIVLSADPYLGNYFQGHLTAAIEESGSTDITITVQLPFITVGQVSVSTSLALFIVTVVGVLVLIGLVFIYDRRREPRSRLAVRAGPVLLFVLSFLVPWASVHTMLGYGSAYHDVYWMFIPGVLAVTQWAGTGQLIVMPMRPVELFSGLWLCLGLFLYSHVRKTDLGWQVRLCILGVALPLAVLLAILLTLGYSNPFNVYWRPSILYLGGPLLLVTSLVWHVFLVPKRKVAANPAATAR